MPRIIMETAAILGAVCVLFLAYFLTERLFGYEGKAVFALLAALLAGAWALARRRLR